MRRLGTILALGLALAATTAQAQAPRRPGVPMNAWSVAQKLQWFPAMETVFEVRTVERGRRVHPLPAASTQIDVSYAFQGRTWTTAEYMAAHNVTGVLVLRDGQVLMERYAFGRKPTDRWTSFSVAKSVTSTLVGAAIADGKLALNDPVERLIPEFKGSAYEGVTVRQLLMMSSGVKWDETYDNPTSDLYKASAWSEPGVNPFVGYLRRLPRLHPPGSTFHYNTAETDIVGLLVSRAVGKSLSAYLSEKIWKPYGMEADAAWMLDSTGLERGGCCLSMTLRDYGRFGQFILDGGVADGRAVTPAGWVAEATRRQIAHDRPAPFGYGYFWWIGPEAFEASGIYGQSILIYPQDRLIIVINSAWPQADGKAMYDPMNAFQRAVRAAALAAPR